MDVIAGLLYMAGFFGFTMLIIMLISKATASNISYRGKTGITPDSLDDTIKTIRVSIDKKYKKKCEISDKLLISAQISYNEYFKFGINKTKVEQKVKSIPVTEVVYKKWNEYYDNKTKILMKKAIDDIRVYEEHSGCKFKKVFTGNW